MRNTEREIRQSEAREKLKALLFKSEYEKAALLHRENALKEALEKAREQIKETYKAYDAYEDWSFYKTIDECLKEHCE